MTVESANDNIKEQEESSKIVRILTVGVYVMAVSGFSFLMASYYLFLWSE